MQSSASQQEIRASPIVTSTYYMEVYFMPMGGPSGGMGGGMSGGGGFMGFMSVLTLLVQLAATGFGVYIFWRALLAFEKFVDKYTGK
jgi:hypothetical protein